MELGTFAAIAGTAATLLMGLNAILLGWLHSRIAKIDERVTMIFNVLDEKYVRKELYRTEIEDLNRRMETLERHPQ